MSRFRPAGWPRASGWIVGLLFLILGAELTLSIPQLSQTFDESFHVFSGYQYWRHRDYGANPEHPPLVKLLATVPLLRMDLAPTPILQGPTKPAHITGGVQFLYHSGVPAAKILLESRLAASILTYLLAILVFLAANALAGPVAGLIALTLVVFEPNILANGALVTTDIAISLFLLASVITFYRYARKPTPARLLVCGLVTGLALASKHSAVLLGGILPLVALGDMVFGETRKAPLAARAARALGSLAVIFGVAYVVLWAMYTFQFAARPDGFALVPSLAERTRDAGNSLPAQVVDIASRRHLLPESYLWGLSDVLIATKGRTTFLFGTVYPTGQWFYFPAVFVMKSTLAILALLLAAPFVFARFREPSDRRFEYSARVLWFLVVPTAVYGWASVSSGLNIGFRHILPVVPFLIVLAAASGAALAQRSRTLAGVVAILLAGHIISSLRVFPNYLTYSNELAGGPSRTWRLTNDANADWGQGMVQAARFLAARNIRDCWYVPTLPHVDPKDAGIPCRVLQASNRTGIAPPHPAVVEGTLLVSTYEISGQNWGPGELNPYGFLADRKPDALIANSILVFSGRFEFPLAAASNRTRRADLLLSEGRVEDAIAEAREAVAIVPSSAETQATLCTALVTANRGAEARPFCLGALEIADRVHPEYQYGRIPALLPVARMRRRGTLP